MQTGMGRPIKSGSKPRPGKTQTNRFSRVGPTLVAWMQAQEEGDEGSLEEHFQKELKDRAHPKESPNSSEPVRSHQPKVDPKVDDQPRKAAAKVPEPPKVRPPDDDSDDSGAEESEACSDFGTMSDTVGEEDDMFSETSYAEREADYGSSEDECYQIDSKRSIQQRPFGIRSRRTIARQMIPMNNVHTLKEEDFVPE